MQQDCLVLEPDLTLGQAAGRMRGVAARHAAVVHSDLLCGIVSQRDVVEGLAALGAGAPLERITRREPLVVEASTTLEEAARRMLRLRIGCLAVVRTGLDGDVLLGLISESDLVRAAYGPEPERRGEP